MKEGPNIAHVAALIGDPARANMLTALLSGKALTATELANEAGITTQTASSHLRKLSDGKLLSPRKQGRHKYFTIANEDVAQVLGGLMGLAAGAGHTRTRTGPRDTALRHARSCYNHLAGTMGTHLFDSLITQNVIDSKRNITPSGRNFIAEFGIDLTSLEGSQAPLCRDCLDWSERRTHLAGSLGRAFLARFEALGWITRTPNSRVVTFTKSGKIQFAKHFPL